MVDTDHTLCYNYIEVIVVKETNFKNYYVTEEGLFISKNRNYSGKDYKIIKPSIKKSGYASVIMCINGKVIHRRLHRLVAETFIPNPDNKPCVNHKDGNKLNNHVSNLEWCTYKENIKHALDTGLMPSIKGSNNPKAKITFEIAEQIRADYKIIKSYRKVAQKYNIDYTSVADIVKFRTWNN